MEKKSNLTTKIICPVCRDAQAHMSCIRPRLHELRCPSCGFNTLYSGGTWAEAQAYFESIEIKEEMEECKMPKFLSDLLHNGAAKLTIAPDGDPRKIYVHINGRNYIFVDGKYQGWYNPEGPNG